MNLCHDFLIHILLGLDEILSPMDLLSPTPGPCLLYRAEFMALLDLAKVAELHIEGLFLWAGMPPLIN